MHDTNRGGLDRHEHNQRQNARAALGRIQEGSFETFCSPVCGRPSLIGIALRVEIPLK